MPQSICRAFLQTERWVFFQYFWVSTNIYLMAYQKFIQQLAELSWEFLAGVFIHKLLVSVGELHKSHQQNHDKDWIVSFKILIWYLMAAFLVAVYCELLVFFLCLFLQINDVEEVSLSANQKKSQMKKMQWHIRGAAGSQTSSSRDRDPMSNKYSVVLAPMEIRTFLIEF